MKNERGDEKKKHGSKGKKKKEITKENSFFLSYLGRCKYLQVQGKQKYHLNSIQQILLDESLFFWFPCNKSEVWNQSTGRMNNL